MNPIVGDLLWGAVILLFLGACFGCVKRIERYKSLHPETARKLVHMSMGVAVLPFPWVFHYKTTVVVLGVLATGGLLFLRLFASGEKEMGSALYRVKRLDSVGELVYPGAVVITYLIAPTKEFYVTPILVLVFADSMAALVGTGYAKTQLSQSRRESPKSMEGAVAFFFSAFLCVVSPLLLFSELEGRQILLVSLILAFLSALLELVCPFGLDNFFIPFVSVLFLYHLSSYSFYQLVGSFFLLALFAVVSALLMRYKNITLLGIVEVLLAACLTTLLGSFFWVLAPFVLFLTYSIAPALTQEEKEAPLNYHDIESNVLPGVLIIIVGVLTGGPALVFWTYSTYYACMTAKNHYLRVYHYHRENMAGTFAAAFVRGCLLQLLPAALLYRGGYGAFPGWPYYGAAWAAVLLELAVSAGAVGRYRFPKISLRLGWLCSLTSAFFAAAGALVLLLVRI